MSCDSWYFILRILGICSLRIYIFTSTLLYFIMAKTNLDFLLWHPILPVEALCIYLLVTTHEHVFRTSILPQFIWRIHVEHPEEYVHNAEVKLSFKVTERRHKNKWKSHLTRLPFLVRFMCDGKLQLYWTSMYLERWFTSLLQLFAHQGLYNLLLWTGSLPSTFKDLHL